MDNRPVRCATSSTFLCSVVLSGDFAAHFVRLVKVFVSCCTVLSFLGHRTACVVQNLNLEQNLT